MTGPGNPTTAPEGDAYLDAMQCVERSRACLGLIASDGFVKAFSARMSEALGFDDPEATRGLRIVNLWDDRDRPAVERAFAQALKGGTVVARIALQDEGSGSVASARVTFGRGPGTDAVLMTLDRLDG